MLEAESVLYTGLTFVTVETFFYVYRPELFEMSKSKVNTWERILDSACLLFSEEGFDDVSTRQISRHANIQHGNLYYHFKNKEAIYHEVFRKVYDLDNALTYDVLQQKEPLIFDTPEGKAYAIQRIVFDYYQRHVYISDEWRKKFIHNELAKGSSIFSRHVEESLQEVYDKMIKFYFLLRPEGSLPEAYHWSHIPDAFGLYSFMTKDTLKRQYDKEFIKALSHIVVINTAKTMIFLMDLPIPPMLIS